MKEFPIKIGIVDAQFSLFNCNIFEITFPPDEEFANNSKLGYNPWGYYFRFVYDFKNGILIFCDDYSTLDIEETMEDALSSLKVYEDGMEWCVNYREDENSWMPAEKIEFRHRPGAFKWKRPHHQSSPNDIRFPVSDWGEEITLGNGNVIYQQGSNSEIDKFYEYCFGDGFNTLIKVSNSVIEHLK
jgi:hypothetical protein